MDIEKLIELIKEKIYTNHNQEVSAKMVEEAVIAVAEEIGVSHIELKEAIESSESLTELVKKDLEEFKQVQSEIDQKQNIEISKSNKELETIKDALKHLGSNNEIEVVKGGGTISLPNNAMSSVAPSYKINGLTLNNLIKNGNFSDGSNGWILSNQQHYKIEDGKLIFEGKADSWGFIKKEFASQKEDKIALIFNCSRDFDVENTPYFWINNIGAEKEHTVVPKKGLNVFIEDGINYLQIQQRPFVAKRIEYSNFMAINLTQTFGKGNEPTKEWCDEHITGYFEGVKSVQAPMRIKSVGENLWNNDISNDNYKYKGGHGNYVQLSPNLYYRIFGDNGVVGSKFIKNDIIFESIGYGPQGCRMTNLKPNALYFLGFTPDWDEDRDVYKLFGNKYGSKKIKNTRLYVEVKSNSLGMIDTVFVEDSVNDKTTNLIYKDVTLSEKKIDFKPYVESNLYINNQLELKSVGTTKDYIENGKLYQNTKKYYFTKEDEWTLRDDYEGDNFRYYMTLPFDYKTTGAGVENELLCNNFIAAPNVASVLTEREDNTIVLYRENASTVYLTLDKKVSDVNSVIPEGTFIDVILPQTEVVNLSTSGLIANHSNGTVFIEPITNITDFYNNGLDVSNYNIEEIEEFSIFEGGVYQQLDVSKVKITDGKLTHPDAKNGLVYLVFKYDKAPIYGENEVSYYNSDVTLKSPNGKIWKKVETATDTGDLVTKLEEVVVKEVKVEPKEVELKEEDK